MSELQKIEAFRYELAVAETYDEIKALDTKIAAIQEFARRNKVSKEKQDEIGVFRIEIEQKKGVWLDEFFPQGGTGSNQYTKEQTSKGSSLADVGVSYDESANARLMAKEREEVNQVIEDLKKDDRKVITPNAVQNEVRKRQKKQRNEEILKNNRELQTEKKYRVVYADPPWKYNDKQIIDSLGGAEKHYPTMSIGQLCALPVNDLTEENAVLFLWVTSPLLEESFEVIQAWGFTYKTSFVWDKVKHNMGHYNSVRHEFLLVCTKGSCTPDERKLFDSVQSIDRSGHSEKPKIFREIIETIYTNGKRVELFARKETSGWDVWGNEV